MNKPDQFHIITSAKLLIGPFNTLTQFDTPLDQPLNPNQVLTIAGALETLHSILRENNLEPQLDEKGNTITVNRVRYDPPEVIELIQTILSVESLVVEEGEEMPYEKLQTLTPQKIRDHLAKIEVDEERIREIMQ